MRIKFRAWDFERTRYWYPCRNWPDRAALDDGNVMVKGAERFFEEPNQYVLEQYTGLKDSKGVEIYEGDVLREDDVNSVVRWENGTWVSEWRVRDYRSYDKNGELDTWILETEPLALCLDGEVIGNIHQNPDLIG